MSAVSCSRPRWSRAVSQRHGARLRNIIVECFAPRYLVSQGRACCAPQALWQRLSTADLTQLMLVFTSRANPDSR
jgi:hypothetical protein